MLREEESQLRKMFPQLDPVHRADTTPSHCSSDTRGEMNRAVLATEPIVHTILSRVSRDDQVMAKLQNIRAERPRHYNLLDIRFEGVFEFQHTLFVLEESVVPGL